MLTGFVFCQRLFGPLFKVPSSEDLEVEQKRLDEQFQAGKSTVLPLFSLVYRIFINTLFLSLFLHYSGGFTQGDPRANQYRPDQCLCPV